jgi:hypothetical protein
MKKAILTFSLTVLAVFTVYVSLKLSKLLISSPTYIGMSSAIAQNYYGKDNGANVISAIIFDFRSLDTLSQGIMLLSSSIAVGVIIKGSTKLRGKLKK